MNGLPLSKQVAIMLQSLTSMIELITVPCILKEMNVALLPYLALIKTLTMTISMYYMIYQSNTYTDRWSQGWSVHRQQSRTWYYKTSFYSWFEVMQKKKERNNRQYHWDYQLIFSHKTQTTHWFYIGMMVTMTKKYTFRAVASLKNNIRNITWNAQGWKTGIFGIVKKITQLELCGGYKGNRYPCWISLSVKSLEK